MGHFSNLFPLSFWHTVWFVSVFKLLQYFAPLNCQFYSEFLFKYLYSIALSTQQIDQFTLFEHLLNFKKIKIQP